MKTTRSLAIPKKPEGIPAPLSLVQQRLWFLYQLDTQSPEYNISRAWRFKGPLDTEALVASLNLLLARHESLRTIFCDIDEQVVQVIQSALTTPLQEKDWSAYTPTQFDIEVDRFLIEEPLQPFDLRTGPLLRFTLLRFRRDEHVFVFTIHHMVFDGTSLKIFCHELSQCYQAVLNRQPIPFLPLPIQYRDYAYWQQTQFNEEKLAQQVEFWKQYLHGAPLILELPSDDSRSTANLSRRTHQTFTLAPQLLTNLQQLIQPHGVTMFMALLAVFQILLSRYTGKRDILVGTPIARRTHTDLENLIGFFVNTLVLRTHIVGQPTFQDVLRQVRKTCLESYRHQDLSFEKLVETLKPVRDPRRSPVVQAIFQFRQASDIRLFFPQVESDPLPVKNRTGNFDLHMVCEQTESGIEGFLYYPQELYSDSMMTNFVRHYQIVLEKLITKPSTPITQLAFLTDAECHEQLIEWNATTTHYPDQACVHHRFEAQVARTPDAIAVVYEDEQLTYAQLNARSNQLAKHLRTFNVGPEVPVAIYCERSLELFVGLWGVLKAGGAYVPIDSTYPKERVAWMLQDSNVSVVLIKKNENNFHFPQSVKIVHLDEDWPIIGIMTTHNSPRSVTQENMAYILYTSGSTGNPKGVIVTHRGLRNYLNWAVERYEVNKGQGTIVHSSIGFDLTVTSLFCPLMVGGKVELLPEHGGIQNLLQLMQNECDYSFLKMTPAHLDGLNQLLDSNQFSGKVRTLIIGGEALSEDSLKFWHHYAPHTTLINEYGPTETVVGCCVHEASRSEWGGRTIPIGRPIGNTRIYLLQDTLQLSPVGVPGEIYIAGESLARGYMHRPDLTAERFIPEPFGTQRGARQYKTGDRATYRHDGVLDFLGRKDHQVKLRGYRIELGEIEAALQAHNDVSAGVVVCREDLPGEKQLVAYIVGQATASDLRPYLQGRLPDYMVPSAFVVLEQFPLTPNGKIDRQALPGPTAADRTQSGTYVAARTTLEEIIAAIWQEVLSLERVGIHDNFFELGGHSLLATQVIARLRQALELDITLRTLFEHPTITQLAQIIDTRLPNNLSD